MVNDTKEGLVRPYGARRGTRRASILRAMVAVSAACLLLTGTILVLRSMVAWADDDPPLTVEIGAAYNLVVDSNVERPSTD